MLKFQAEREQQLEESALRLNQFLELNSCTVAEVRQFFQAHCVLVYHFEPDGIGAMETESMKTQCKAVLGAMTKEPCFTPKLIKQYQRGHVQVIIAKITNELFFTS